MFGYCLVALSDFCPSERKWKSKLKEWDFDKNLTKAEMKIAVAKAEKRAREDGKETVFFHRGEMIPPARVSKWKRKIMTTESSPLNPYTSKSQIENAMML